MLGCVVVACLVVEETVKLFSKNDVMNTWYLPVNFVVQSVMSDSLRPHGLQHARLHGSFRSTEQPVISISGNFTKRSLTTRSGDI